jgi:small neutral amino acid transporter SnatA (MarC family)
MVLSTTAYPKHQAHCYGVGFHRSPSLLMISDARGSRQRGVERATTVEPDLSASEIFLFFFIMLGPLKMLAPFAHLTAAADVGLTRRVALRAFAISSVTLLVAGLVGKTMLLKWSISTSALALAGGLTLFAVAFRRILDQFSFEEPPPASSSSLTLAAAVSPVAFPEIVTPYGIAVLILLLVLLPDKTITIILQLAIVMLLNLVCMWYVDRIYRPLALALGIFGAILGIMQVALGIQIVIFGIRLWFNKH